MRTQLSAGRAIFSKAAFDLLTALMLVFAATSVAGAQATPPGWINYQGVLRNAANLPIEGSRDMVFRFYSVPSGGAILFEDTHDAAHGNAVIISGGLFSVFLGSGSGGGVYASLPDLLANNGTVYLEIVVAGDTLAPRVRLVSAAFAINADQLDGRQAASFLDTSATSQTKSGALTIDAPGMTDYGLYARGYAGGGKFEDKNASGYAYVANGHLGIEARGDTGGGYFKDLQDTSYAYAGYGNLGINAKGNTAGGSFEDLNASGSAYVGYGNRGIEAWGTEAGGYFYDEDGDASALIGYAGYGVMAEGRVMGGSFGDSDDSGLAHLGVTDRGISAWGDSAGGYFSSPHLTAEKASAFVAYVTGPNSYGVHATGGTGGYFASRIASGYAYLGYGEAGVEGRGNGVGGRFVDIDDGQWSFVASGSSKIMGGGDMSFVQNHPFEKDRVIVYSAPEGPETATYTRGSARLAGGVARVKLDETFAWVTNPDLGLTAHLTPRGAGAELYVESLDPAELVVRAAGGAPDVAFDYLVYGLRIGFEETCRVREKTLDAPIPSMKSHQEQYQKHPELRRFNAWERFREMNAAVGIPADPEPARAAALRAAIREFDPKVDLWFARNPTADPPPETRPESGNVAAASTAERPLPAEAPLAAAPVTAARECEGVAAELVPVAERVQPGDVLVLDPADPGRLRRAARPADPFVAGIALAAATLADGRLQAPVAGAGFAVVRASAAQGPIRAGDLLTTSADPGVAVLAPVAIPGTILGKALDALDSGSGTIRIVVALR